MRPESLVDRLDAEADWFDREREAEKDKRWQDFVTLMHAKLVMFGVEGVLAMVATAYEKREKRRSPMEDFPDSASAILDIADEFGWPAVLNAVSQAWKAL